MNTPTIPDTSATPQDPSHAIPTLKQVHISRYPESLIEAFNPKSLRAESEHPSDAAPEIETALVWTPRDVHARFLKLFSDPDVLSIFIAKPEEASTPPLVIRITKEKIYMTKGENKQKKEVIYEFISGKCYLNHQETSPAFTKTFMKNLQTISAELSDAETDLEVFVEKK